MILENKTQFNMEVFNDYDKTLRTLRPNTRSVDIVKGYLRAGGRDLLEWCPGGKKDWKHPEFDFQLTGNLLIIKRKSYNLIL